MAYARAITIAVHAAPTRVPLLIEQVAPFLAIAAWDLHDVLLLLSRSLAPAHQSELAALWQLVPESERATAAYRLGLLRLGAPPETQDVLNGFPADGGPADQLRVATLEAVLARPLAGRFAGRWVGQLFANATDDLSTKSHFTLAIIRVVDRLIRSVLDEPGASGG